MSSTLLVDDNDAFLEFLEEQAQRWNIGNVVFSRDMEDAFAKFLSEHPSRVVADDLFEGSNEGGLTFLERVRSADPDVELVLLTGGEPTPRIQERLRAIRGHLLTKSGIDSMLLERVLSGKELLDAVDAALESGADAANHGSRSKLKTRADPTQWVSEEGEHDDGSESTADDAASGYQAFGVRAVNLSDRVATQDHLGFEPYVSAVAAFVTNPETQAALTIAVEGAWGSGKSSFMRQVEMSIRREAAQTKHTKATWLDRIRIALNPMHDVGPLTVWFNPWRHDREEALWAAFALEFLRNISRQLPFARRWRGHLKLLHMRLSWRDGRWDILRIGALTALAVTTIGILATWMLDSPRFEQLFTAELQSEAGKGLVGTLLKVGGIAGALAVAVSLVKEVKSFVGNPLRIEWKRFVRSPDYQTRISFIEQFHHDFGKMIQAYAGGQKVYVFIDDLDRCQVPRAADLMQALNLMIGEDQPLVFLLGMDREKIAASLAVKFKDVIPYISGPKSTVEIPWAQADATAGVEFGSEYIEKFVQVAIRVPQPRESDIIRLLADLSPIARVSTTRQPVTEPVAASLPVTPEPVTSEPLPITAEGRRSMRHDVSVDSPRLHDIVRLVAPVLDYNPRRVKQFINACRLHAYIAIETGLIVEDAGRLASDLTFEKLSKFVAIALRWPLLVTHLENDPGLLHRLEAIALGELTSEMPIDLFWVSRPRLIELLRAGLYDSTGCMRPGSAKTYAFKGLDIVQLLR